MYFLFEIRLCSYKQPWTSFGKEKRWNVVQECRAISKCSRVPVSFSVCLYVLVECLKSFHLLSKLKKVEGAVGEGGCRILKRAPSARFCLHWSRGLARYLCSRLPPLDWGLQESKGMSLRALLKVSSTPSLLPSSELILKTYLLNDSKTLPDINQEC